MKRDLLYMLLAVLIGSLFAILTVVVMVQVLA